MINGVQITIGTFKLVDSKMVSGIITRFPPKILNTWRYSFALLDKPQADGKFTSYQRFKLLQKFNQLLDQIESQHGLIDQLSNEGKDVPKSTHEATGTER